MKSQGSNYAEDCKFGRGQAMLAIDEAITSDNPPRLIKQIREMSARNDGQAIGYLYGLVSAAMNGRE